MHTLQNAVCLSGVWLTAEDAIEEVKKLTHDNLVAYAYGFKKHGYIFYMVRQYEK